MIKRCSSPSHEAWSRYGGRGIAVCDRWRESFPAFLADMGERPAWATGGIDRIDNKRGYEPGNCRWATVAQQLRNRRNAVVVTPGQRFSSLVVIEELAERGTDGKRLVLCRCDCGRAKAVSLGKLRSGRSKSCGCKHHPPLL